jgi:isoamylase
VVVDPAFDWERDTPPRTPLHSSIIYEAHIKGFTQLNPAIPENLRGAYAGLSSPASIEYLQSLGITAVELLPIHHHIDERYLVDRGLKNYWGYNTICFFAPDSRYSSSGVSGEQVREFKTMVKTLHAAGIEVILDVVYNHTAEGNHLGPTLGFRSIDNPSYYRLVDSSPRYYMDYTGTGNTVNAMHPRVLQMIMDSLRYWVLEMHVDGFRFDLAAALARDSHHVVQFDWHGNDQRRVGFMVYSSARHAPKRGHHGRARSARAANSGRNLSRPVERVLGARAVHPTREARHRMGVNHRHV